MKALVFRDGQVRLAADRPIPDPAPGEVLVRVSLAGICATDLEIIKGYMGYEGVLGHEFAGVVAQSSRPDLNGARVAGEINIGCGACEYCAGGLARHCPGRRVLGIAGHDGAFAEYLTLPEANLHPLPETVTDEQAVFVEPLAAAFEIPEQVSIGAHDRVCVLGGGRLGLLAAQVLSSLTDRLVAVGRHGQNLRILSDRGIATKLTSSMDNAGGTGDGSAQDLGEKFDFVVECTGSAGGLAQALELVRPRGTIVLKTTAAGRSPIDLNRLVIDEVTLVGSRCGPFPPAIQALAEKRVDIEPLISARFPLSQGVEALDYAARPGVLKVLIEID